MSTGGNALQYFGAADHLSDLLASDAMLASQFFGLRKSVDPSHRSVQRLMLAVLIDALDCFLATGAAQAYSRSGRGRRRAEAEAWLFDAAAPAPFSFAWVCDGLGIDAGYLRAGIRRLAAKISYRLPGL